MKKILSIAVAAFSVAAIAVEFSPEIGVTSLTLSKKNNIIPVQFTSLAGTGDVTPDALVCTNNIPVNTYMYLFVNNTYKAWYLSDSGWVSPATVGTGVPAGEISYSGSATGMTVPVGTAIWISFADTPSPAKQIAVFGKVASVTNSTIAVGSSDSAVSTLVGNPTGGSVALSGKMSEVSPASGDQIQPLGGDTFSGYYIYTTKWQHVYKEGGKMKIEDGLPTIEANQGFWYLSKGGSGTIKW